MRDKMMDRYKLMLLKQREIFPFSVTVGELRMLWGVLSRQSVIDQLERMSTAGLVMIRNPDVGGKQYLAIVNLDRDLNAA